MTTEGQKHRIEKWDIARGILIFLVVLGHMVQNHTNVSDRMRALYLFIYSFHMPCFLFLDGLFSKNVINEKRYTRIFSYLLIYLLVKAINSVTKGIISGSISFHILTETGTAWYGLALFFCFMATIFLRRFPKKWVLCFSIVLACLIGYDNNIKGFLSLSRFFVFYPFFYVGYCIDPKELADRLSSLKARLSGLTIMSIWIIICLFATQYIYFYRSLFVGVNPYSNLTNYGVDNLVIYGGLLRLFYYFMAGIICLGFLAIIPDHLPKFKYLATIGKRSLQIYILHRAVLYILYDGLHLNEWISSIGISYLIIIPIAVIITIILSLPIFEKPIRAMVYPKILDDSEKESS